MGKRKQTKRVPRKRLSSALPIVNLQAAGIDIGATEHWVAVPPGTRYSTYNSPGYRQAAPFAPIVEDSINTADPTDATLEKVPYTGVQYVGIPEFAGMGTTVSQFIASAIAGTDTVRGALQKAQQSVEETMKQAGYL